MQKFKHRIKQHTTKSGFKIVNIKIPNYPISASSVWLDAGSRKDPIGKEGLSHLLEHLFFTKTKMFPNREKRLKKIESNGFYFNAFTNLQSQHYFYLHDLNKSELATKLIADGLFSTKINKKDLETEKEVINNEETQNRENPSDYIWRLANKGIWGEKGLGKDFFGNKRSIESINLKDIDSFVKKNFLTKNLVFVFINSSLPIKKQEAIIEKFTHLNNKLKTQKKQNSNIKQKIIIEKRNIDSIQVAITFTIPKIQKLKDRAIAELTTNYFASGWTSRFVQSLRVKNSLIYWIYPEFSFFEDTAYIRFYFSVAKQDFKKTVSLIINEINKSKKEISNLEDHKNKFLGELKRNSINPNWLINWYGYNALLSNNFDINAFFKELNKLTENDVKEFISKNFVEKQAYLAYIGKSPSIKDNFFTAQL